MNKQEQVNKLKLEIKKLLELQQSAKLELHMWFRVSNTLKIKSKELGLMVSDVGFKNTFCKNMKKVA